MTLLEFRQLKLGDEVRYIRSPGLHSTIFTEIWVVCGADINVLYCYEKETPEKLHKFAWNFCQLLELVDPFNGAEVHKWD